MKPIEFQCQVKSFKMLTPTVFQTSFTTHQALSFKAGQFMSIVIPGAGPKGRDLRRAYSIASPPESPEVELCIKIVEEGPGTSFLKSLRPGDTFRAVAPYGDFVFEPKPNRNVCFIATGTGLAPFRAMALSQEFHTHLPPQSFCLLGVRTEDELIYQATFENIPGMKFIPAVSRPQGHWKGFQGRVTDYLRSLKNSEFPWKETEFYLCGNGGMITEVKSVLTEKGVSSESIHQEIYYK
jgi:CDP-4-dehydro-6-deoxyglucose reductase, E3